jgi:dsRNA-specific ribonuclease
MEAQVEKIKKIYQALYRKALHGDGRLRVEYATLGLFFNTILRKKAVEEAQMNDRIVQRFFTDFSGENYTKLKHIFEIHSQNEKVYDLLIEELLKLGSSLKQAETIITPLNVKYLRILCFPKTHVIETSLLRDTLYKLLIERGNLRADVVNSFLNLDVLEMYKQAFTHSSVSKDKNYEVWETLGDGTMKGAIRLYSVRRFPEILVSDRASETLTNIGQNYESKKSFSKVFDYLGFDQISAYREELLHLHPQFQLSTDRIYGDFVLNELFIGIKEDIFEAFIGATNYLIDSKIQLGLGNAICYNILSSVLDEQEMELSVTASKDSVSKLKEIFDKSKLVYENVKGKKLDTFYFHEHQYETDPRTGKIRMKLDLTFLPDPTGKRRNIIKKFVITQKIVESLVSDWFESTDDAKKNVASKALQLLAEKYDVHWIPPSSDLDSRFDLDD